MTRISPTQQLVMDLAAEPAMGMDDFVQSPVNEAAWTLLGEVAQWPTGMMILVGPPASGKTHLASIWCSANHANRIPAQSVAGDTLTQDTHWLAIEDCETGFADETTMFHLANDAMSGRRKLLLTAQSEPQTWPVQMADLASRLRGVPVAAIDQPDDDLIAALFVKHCADRQLRIEAPALRAALPRVERSYAFVRDCVARLDTEMLRTRRPLTRALVLETLAAMGPETGR